MTAAFAPERPGNQCCTGPSAASVSIWSKDALWCAEAAPFAEVGRRFEVCRRRPFDVCLRRVDPEALDAACLRVDLAAERDREAVPPSERARPEVALTADSLSPLRDAAAPPLRPARLPPRRTVPEDRPLRAADARLVVPVASATAQPAWTASGTSISRFKIFPVGPFGSSSTNQILRGYL
ncbi:MAG: hypothetical protein NVSMB25_23840 [Thermoleophilaceae bacterium]